MEMFILGVLELQDVLDMVIIQLWIHPKKWRFQALVVIFKLVVIIMPQFFRMVSSTSGAEVTLANLVYLKIK